MNDDLISRSALLQWLEPFKKIGNAGIPQLLEAINAQPTIDAVAKDKVITCVTGIIRGYSDAHVVTCAVCGLPFPDYELEETTECRWCKAKSHSEAYAPSGPGYCTTSQDRKAKTFDKLFSSQHCVARMDRAEENGK